MACIDGDRDPPAAVGDGAAARDVVGPWTSPLTPFPFDLPVIRVD